MNNQNFEDLQIAILKRFILPFFQWIETLLLRLLLLISVGLIGGQMYILSSPENQALVNKAVRYEGVFDTEEIDATEIWKVNKPLE